MSRAAAAFKRVLVGRPMASGELEHTLLPKTIALPVFSSDPLSSVNYATQEILLVLGTVGIAALRFTFPIAIAVACLLAIVVTSYRQTVRAYPSGGGAYRVSRENLGMHPGLLAASALLIDYTLTVAVSTVAGVDAITSAFEGLVPHKIELAIGFIAFVALMNLRGVRESGVFFAIPTYGFVLSIYILLATGFIRCFGGGCPAAESSDLHLEPEQALTFFLILKAFAAGTTALTGVEAISDGVPAFRYPQSRNAATTLAVMGTISITMFLGISWLADQTNVRYIEGLEHQKTVMAQVASAVLGHGPLFYLVQAMSAAILILAANTAYQDFPRLSSILAGDRFMPRQFRNRGDRLVFSNGVVTLSVLAGMLIVAFDANLNRLIQLYLVGVFIGFTLSQWGMVVRWRRLRTPGWYRRALINGFGGTVTGIVLCVVVATKFLGGAWIVVSAIPVLMFLMRSIYKHYRAVGRELAHPERRTPALRPGNQHVVILVDRVDAATARSVGYVRAIRPADVSAVTYDSANYAAWYRLAPEIPLEILEGKSSRPGPLKRYLRSRRRGLGSHDFLTVVIPEILKSRRLVEVFTRPAIHRLKASLLREKGVQVVNVPIVRDEIVAGVDQAHEPGRNFVCVLVSGVHNATFQAIEFAETLGAHDVRAVSFSLDPAETERLGDEWLAAGIPHPLEIHESPFRDIGISLVDYLRQFRADGVNRIVTVVLPEFVVKKNRHQVLHNQTGLIVKRRVLFEPGVVAASVPYHLQE